MSLGNPCCGSDRLKRCFPNLQSVCVFAFVSIWVCWVLRASVSFPFEISKLAINASMCQNYTLWFPLTPFPISPVYSLFPLSCTAITPLPTPIFFIITMEPYLFIYFCKMFKSVFFVKPYGVTLSCQAEVLLHKRGGIISISFLPFCIMFVVELMVMYWLYNISLGVDFEC